MTQSDLPEEKPENQSGDQAAAADNPEDKDNNLPNWDWLDQPGKVHLRVPGSLKKPGGDMPVNPEETGTETAAGETQETPIDGINPDLPAEAANLPEAGETTPAEENLVQAVENVPSPVEEQPTEPASAVPAAEMETQPVQPSDQAEGLEAAAPLEEAKKQDLPAQEELENAVTSSQPIPENASAVGSEAEKNPDIQTLESKIEPTPLPAYREGDTQPVAARHVPPSRLKQSVTVANGITAPEGKFVASGNEGTTARSRLKSKSASSLPVSEKIPEADKGINPGSKLRAMEAGSQKNKGKLPLKFRLLQKGESTRRAAWDLAAITSLIINAVLIGIVVLLAIQIRNLKNSLAGVLESLYGSIALMDQAGVATTASVDTQIPLNFSLPIQQVTDVTLAQSVNVPGAYFLFNGSRVPVNVTLPSGMTLPISMNMNIPVQVSVPITLQVPVNIPLNQTQLHESFINLQNTLRPLVCIFDKNAQYPEGIYLCGENSSATTTTP